MDEIDLEKFKELVEELVEGLPDGDTLTIRYVRNVYMHPSPWYARIETGDHQSHHEAIGYTLAEVCMRMMRQTGMKAKFE